MDEKSEVERFIKKYLGIFEFLDERGKVLCKLSNHEIPCKILLLREYVETKKFKRLYKKLKSPEKIYANIEGKYKDFFVPSKKNPSRLFCTLTKKEVNKLPHELEKYVSGYKFRKAYYQWKHSRANQDTLNGTDIEGNRETMEDIPYFAISDSNDEDDMDMNIESDFSKKGVIMMEDHFCVAMEGERKFGDEVISPSKVTKNVGAKRSSSTAKLKSKKIKKKKKLL